MFLFDTHMHFDLLKEQTRLDVLETIEKKQSYTIAMTNLPDLYEKYYREHSEYKFVKIALGFHPELVYRYSNQMDKFLKYVDTTRYIGEVGLDFTDRDEDRRHMQIKTFKKIVECCDAKGKILSVHSRKAEKECINVLEEYRGKVIFHWYSGSKTVLKDAIDKGYYFSINQNMIRSINGRSIIDAIPLDQILIESDAPFTTGVDKKYSLDFIASCNI